jgi:Arylsulfotransferase (ASST)
VRRPDGTISLFDNEATPPRAEQSRGLVLALDERRMTARVVREYTHPERLLSIAEGSMQTLANGNVFVGWGPAPHISELAPGGRLLLDLTLPEGSDSYQAFRYPWVGEPPDPPALATRRRDGGVTVWASWNGATEVARWQVLGGEAPDALVPLASSPRRGFETGLSVRPSRYVAVRALDASGAVLGTSRTIRP